MMISYTASREGLAVLEEEIGSLKEALYPERDAREPMHPAL